MNFLRTLSIRDVGTALKRHEFGLALRIGQNLCGNAIGNARSNFARRASAQTKRAVRGAV